MEIPIIELFDYNETQASQFIDENIIQKLPPDVQRIFLQLLQVPDVNIGITFVQNKDNHRRAMKLLIDEFFIPRDGTVLQLVNGLLSEKVKKNWLVEPLIQNGQKLLQGHPVSC